MVGQTLSWADVVVAIPTVASRRQLLAELTARLRDECPDADVVVRRHVPGTSPRMDLPSLVDCALAADRPWLLLLEDDVWLCPEFGRRAIDALARAAELGADALSLFSRLRHDLTLLDRGESFRRQAPSGFCMMQAVFITADVMAGFCDWAPEWYEAHPCHQHAADLLLGAWLSRQRASLFVHVPSLVQHRAVPSTLPNHRGIRQSETYRRAFGPVPGEDR